ncbi:MAG TPA: ATP-binding protein [Anaerolineae bacterium]|nr:ATP-binding protein [Anaerolineae bacterium]HQK15053.1 ATP-binding protein [Anaerolineae bacterium]
MFSSLRIKLLLSHLAVIILAMGLSGVLLLSFLERYFLEAIEENLMAQAQITAQTLIPGATVAGADIEPQAAEDAATVNVLQQRRVSNISVQTQNLAVPESAVTVGNVDLSYLANTSLELGTQLETHIRIVDAAGMVVLDSRNADIGVNLRDDPLVAQALNGQYVNRVERGDINTMTVALPLHVTGKLAGVVYLSQPLTDVTTVVRDVRSRLLLSTMIALLLSGIVGLVFSRAITRPVRHLTDAAGAVAQGHFGTQVPARSRDELGQLSRAFNDMTLRLRAARQMQTDFVANVSHELRTPLTSIKGMVETLRAGAVEDLDVRDRFLGTVESETDRLIRLVNDLLLLSRADSEALNLRREPVDAVALVRAAVERMTPQADVAGVTLQVAAAPAGLSVWADSDRIAQVLVNLLDNAIKYSRPGGEVTVSVSPGPEHTVLIQVRDQGVGIPADALPRIGERFYRADKARSRAHGGSGLGLAIAQALIEAHGGKLWLESREGEGTTARFTLPGV